MSAYVDRFSYSLGERLCTVEESVAAGRVRAGAPALRDAGFERHRICEDGATAYELARRAVEPLRGGLGGVGAIVYATCLPQNANAGEPARFEESRDVKHLMEFPASRLQSEFGLDRAVVFGLGQQACTSMLGSLNLARALLLAEPELGSVLCVSADRFPPGALYEQAYNLVSDGAAACVVSGEPKGFKLLAWHGITNGALAAASDDETVGSYFNYTHLAVQRTLAKAGLGIADVDWIVPQNMNVKAWRILARLLAFDPGRVYFESLPEVGHIISADNIVNLKRLEESGKLQRGQRVLLAMAGLGLNWQCLLLEKA